MSVVGELFTLCMRRNHDVKVSEFAERHHGVFGLHHLREMQVTPTEIRRRIESGRWSRAYDGVYRLAGVPITWKSELLAAVLAGGTSAAASHRSACALFELPGGRTDIVEITCPRWRRNHEHGPVVHESKALDSRDSTVVDNVPTMSPELALLSLGAVCSPLVVEMALDVALRRELLTYTSARDVVDRLAQRGRNGAGVLRKIIDERVPQRAVPESPMETRLLRLLEQLGFPPPVPQYEVCHHGKLVGRLDAAYPEARIGLEFESIEYHTGKLALISGNARRNRFTRVGWTVIGVTIADLRNRGRLIAPTLDIALRRARGFGAEQESI
jgi:hypothetical protein